VTAKFSTTPRNRRILCDSWASC